MDANRFDSWVASAADAGSSRRSLLARLTGGALAAVLATLGIGGFSAEDAEAKKKGGGRRRGGKKKAKTCEQKCNKRGKKRGGGKSKGGGKRKKSSQSKAACLATCNPAAGGGGGGGGGTSATPGFPISPDPDDIDISINIPCTTPGEQGVCIDGRTCVEVGGLGLAYCLQECSTVVACSAGSTCVLGVCLPLDVGGQCDSADDCDTGFCADIDPVTQLGVCELCDGLSVCGTPSDPVCCVAEATCVGETCVIQTGP